MARNDPQVNLRLPAELKIKLDLESERSGRSLTAEITSRLQMSLEAPTGNMLAPTIARMERDLARLELDKATEMLKLWLVANMLKRSMESLPANVAVPGPLENVTPAEWIAICNNYIAQTKDAQVAVRALSERYETAEAKLRVHEPPEANPLRDLVAKLTGVGVSAHSFKGIEGAIVKLDERSRFTIHKPTPGVRRQGKK